MIGRHLKVRVSKGFKQWKLLSMIIREGLNQSMRAINNQSYKRRWENPSVKFTYYSNYLLAIVFLNINIYLINRLVYKKWIWSCQNDSV